MVNDQELKNICKDLHSIFQGTEQGSNILNWLKREYLAQPIIPLDNSNEDFNSTKMIFMAGQKDLVHRIIYGIDLYNNIIINEVKND